MTKQQAKKIVATEDYQPWYLVKQAYEVLGLKQDMS